MLKREINIIKELAESSLLFENMGDQKECSLYTNQCSGLLYLKITLIDESLELYVPLRGASVTLNLKEISSLKFDILKELIFYLSKSCSKSNILDFESEDSDQLNDPSYINEKFLEFEDTLCYNLNTYLKSIGKETF